MVQASLRQMNVKGTEHTLAKLEQAGLVYISINSQRFKHNFVSFRIIRKKSKLSI